MGEALIVRRGGNSGGGVTIDGKNVTSKISLKSIDLNRGEFESCPYASAYGAAVILDGEIHILGGTGGNRSHYAWNGTSWRYVSELPYYMYNAAAAVVDGKIHLVGTNNNTEYIYHYMWDGSTWTTLTAFDSRGINNISAISVNNTLYVGNMNSGIKRWDGDAWTSIRSGNWEYYKLCSINNELYVITQTTTNNTAYLEKWNGSSFERISSITRTSQGLGGAIALGFDNEIHLFGGSGSNYTYSRYHSWWDGTKWTEEQLLFDFMGGNALKLEDGIHLLLGVRVASSSAATKDHSLLNDKFYIEQYVENKEDDSTGFDISSGKFAWGEIKSGANNTGVFTVPGTASIHEIKEVWAWTGSEGDTCYAVYSGDGLLVATSETLNNGTTPRFNGPFVYSAGTITFPLLNTYNWSGCAMWCVVVYV